MLFLILISFLIAIFLFVVGIILIIFSLTNKQIRESKRRGKYLFFGWLGIFSPFILPFITVYLLIFLTHPGNPLSHWTADFIYFSFSETVGNPSFHKVKNQKGEVKEIYEQKDVITARKFQIQIIDTGYSDNKFTKEIDSFLEEDDVNIDKTKFANGYCYAEFKLTNLVTHGFRTDGRDIEATKVEDKNLQKVEQFTFYPSNNINNNDMDNAGQWKTGVVAFACHKNADSSSVNEYFVSFSSCQLRDGCGPGSENSCLSNSFCPYKNYQEYIRDIKFAIQV